MVASVSLGVFIVADKNTFERPVVDFWIVFVLN